MPSSASTVSGMAVRESVKNTHQLEHPNTSSWWHQGRRRRFVFIF